MVKQTFSELGGESPNSQILFRKKAATIVSFAKGNVLDIGCRTGRIFAEVVSNAIDVENLVGLDIDPEYLHSARSCNPTGPFLLCDAQALAFEDASFDTVMAGDIIEHLGQPHRVLDGRTRVL